AAIVHIHAARAGNLDTSEAIDLIRACGRAVDQFVRVVAARIVTHEYGAAQFRVALTHRAADLDTDTGRVGQERSDRTWAAVLNRGNGRVHRALIGKPDRIHVCQSQRVLERDRVRAARRASDGDIGIETAGAVQGWNRVQVALDCRCGQGVALRQAAGR